MFKFRKKKDVVVPTEPVEVVEAPTPVEYVKPIDEPKEPVTSVVTPHAPNAARIMITNGGPHPPELWAQVTAEHIAPVNPDMVGQRRIDALNLQVKVTEILKGHHTKVRDEEVDNLKHSEHLLTDLAPEPYIDQVIKEIQEVSVGTPWEDHFHNPDVIKLIFKEISSHFATHQHEHRGWHAHKNQHLPHSKAWFAKHHPGV